jgi:hypothetical protein
MECPEFLTPIPPDMLAWEIARAIANAVHENPPPRPVGMQ